MLEAWSNYLPIVSFRVARPTDQLEKVVSFYRDGLGLPVIGSFEGHAGYSGVMLGMPDINYHLEFTHHENGSPCPAPTDDNLLVFYFIDKGAIDRIATRLGTMGYFPVPPENPYWIAKGTTIPDPDGWRIVLMDASEV